MTHFINILNLLVSCCILYFLTFSLLVIMIIFFLSHNVGYLFTPFFLASLFIGSFVTNILKELDLVNFYLTCFYLYKDIVHYKCHMCIC